MKKAFRRIHLWLSVPFGLIITVICLSGAALVFEDEVMELCRHDLYYVEKAGGAPLPVEHLIGKVAETLPDSVTVTGVSISSDAERAYQVSLSKPRRASIYVCSRGQGRVIAFLGKSINNKKKGKLLWKSKLLM